MHECTNAFGTCPQRAGRQGNPLPQPLHLHSHKLDHTPILVLDGRHCKTAAATGEQQVAGKCSAVPGRATCKHASAAGINAATGTSPAAAWSVQPCNSSQLDGHALVSRFQKGVPSLRSAGRHGQGTATSHAEASRPCAPAPCFRLVMIPACCTIPVADRWQSASVPGPQLLQPHARVLPSGLAPRRSSSTHS